MKAVWLSSTYYLDEAVQKLSANAERMLTRGIALCGNAESGGYITEAAINMLGLPNAKKLVKELVDGDILIPQPDGRWYFDAWQDWNSSGDALVARRKADRDRQAKRRESQRTSQRTSRRTSRPKSRDRSRDSSRDVTPLEESREEQNSGYVENGSPDSNASEPRSAPVCPDAWKLVQEIIPAQHPNAVRTELALQASALLKAGHPADLVADALRLWTTKGVHPKTLPALVSELINTRNKTSTASKSGPKIAASDAAFAAAQALKSTNGSARLELEK